MIDASDSVHRSARFLERVTRVFAKVFIPLMVALFLTVAGLIVIVVIQRHRASDANERIDKLEAIVESLQQSSNETKESAQAAKIAAESANRTLQDAVARSSQNEVSPEVADALAKINDVYVTCVQRKDC